MKPLQKLKSLYHSLIHSHATPEEVAWGFALGIFVAMTPTLGLHTIIVIALAALLKKNEIAAVIGVWVVNPVTLFPVFYFIYKVGLWILREPARRELRPESLTDFFHLGGKLVAPLWAGGIVVGLISALVSFYLVKWIYPYLRKMTHRQGKLKI